MKTFKSEAEAFQHLNDEIKARNRVYIPRMCPFRDWNDDMPRPDICGDWCPHFSLEHTKVTDPDTDFPVYKPVAHLTCGGSIRDIPVDSLPA